MSNVEVVDTPEEADLRYLMGSTRRYTVYIITDHKTVYRSSIVDCAHDYVSPEEVSTVILCAGTKTPIPRGTRYHRLGVPVLLSRRQHNSELAPTFGNSRSAALERDTIVVLVYNDAAWLEGMRASFKLTGYRVEVVEESVAYSRAYRNSSSEH